jgi:nicotinamide-nucleotide amidase
MIFFITNDFSFTFQTYKNFAVINPELKFMSVKTNCKVIYLAIGDELLVGQTVNTNAAYMGAWLNEIGVEMENQLVVRDTAQAIEMGLAWCSTKGNVVLITGGLGPTKDDITKTTLARWFGKKLIADAAQLERIKQYFEKRKRPMLEVNLKQAEVLEGCDVIANYTGTSPGMWIEKNGIVYVSMPGVPYEMQAMMQEFVLPRLRQMHVGEEIVHRTLLTQGIGESFLAEKIKKVEDKILSSGFSLAYLPSPGMVKLRITGRGEPAAIKAEIDLFAGEIYKTAGEFIFAEGEESLENVVGQLLREKKMKVGFVESCTGGKAGARIASVSGASDYFEGSIASYSYNVKENLVGIPHDMLLKEGAVSEYCAREMAVRGQKILGVDVCVSTTGIAGPTGGTPDKPVGLVWFGIADKNGVKTFKRIFGADRQRNIHMTVNEALRLLQLQLLGRLPE